MLKKYTHSVFLNFRVILEYFLFAILAVEEDINNTHCINTMNITLQCKEEYLGTRKIGTIWKIFKSVIKFTQTIKYYHNIYELCCQAKVV